MNGLVVETGTPSHVKNDTPLQAVSFYPLIIKKSVGRPTVFTDDVVKKLEEAFALDCTVEEACFYAGISRQSFYNMAERDPVLFDRLNDLRNMPVLAARRTVIGSLASPEFAFRYLSHKRSEEFGQKAKIDLNAKVESHSTTATLAVIKVVDEFETKLRETIVQESKKKQTP